jgi:hypothetical protein
MTVAPSLRKLALTVHVVSSVGWLGAVTAFLALAVAGRTSSDAELVRGSYLALEVIGWFVIVPLCAASFASGVLQAWITSWGLLEHYWVVIKLLMTVFATILLVLHMRPVGIVADEAGASVLADDELGGLRLQLLADAAAAILLLLVAATLSVFKPRGRTRYGWRKQNRAMRGEDAGRCIAAPQPADDGRVIRPERAATAALSRSSDGQSAGS